MTEFWDGFPDHGQPASQPDLPDADVRALAGPETQEAVERVRHELGIGVPRTRFRPGGLADRPDVSGLAEGLGLK